MDELLRLKGCAGLAVEFDRWDEKIADSLVDNGSQYVNVISGCERFQRKDCVSALTFSEAMRLHRDEELSREYDCRYADFVNACH